jgi:hypothetical protein
MKNVQLWRIAWSDRREKEKIKKIKKKLAELVTRTSSLHFSTLTHQSIGSWTIVIIRHPKWKPNQQLHSKVTDIKSISVEMNCGGQEISHKTLT